MRQPLKINPDPVPFDEEERALMQAFDKALEEGTLTSGLTGARRATLEASARVTMRPPKAQITTRLARQDLARLKARALALGMPYQTLLASIVHQYVEGTLVEKEP